MKTYLLPSVSILAERQLNNSFKNYLIGFAIKATYTTDHDTHLVWFQDRSNYVAVNEWGSSPEVLTPTVTMEGTQPFT